jgi:hypothetical protein
MLGIPNKTKHISSIEKHIILDNRKKYFNSIAKEKLLTRIHKKCCYIHHVNKKKRTFIL